MNNTDEDVAFSLLPHRLRNRIDRAFDAVISDALPSDDISSSLSLKKHKTYHEEHSTVHAQPLTGSSSAHTAPGGFIIDEPAPGGFVIEEPQAGGFVTDGPQAGGFVADDRLEETTQHPKIPLSLIPAALQLLDLPPNDEDVLDVFRNAASGWENHGRSTSSDAQLFVERKDWRSVCTALLEPLHDAGGDQDVDMAEGSQRDESLASGSGDEYQDHGAESISSEEEGDDSGDEYREETFTKTKAKRKAVDAQGSRARSRQKSTVVSDSGDEEPVGVLKQITPRQKKVCRKIYALFFPDVGDTKLDSQRLMIKDITRVAKLLKEKITAEEILEMLEAFSSSPDKSMNLSDFERMMVTAKLA